MENLTSYQAQTRRLFTILFGTAAIIGTLLFGTAALIHSASPATADAAPSTITESGRYAMQMNSVYTGSKTAFYILVWDTNSGRSKIYYGSTEMGKISAAGSAYNLPSTPL